MKSMWRYLGRAAAFLLLLAVLLAVCLYPEEQRAPKTVRVVTVWNVDAFEGGKGSRTAFLRRVAAIAERGRENVRYLISGATTAGAEAALIKGSPPDVLSFGGAVEGLRPLCRRLDASFAGEDRALPWCRGEYYLFCMEEDFTAAGETIVSSGGGLSCVAAYLNAVTGKEAEPLTAYLAFLNGEYRYLLGTQRDVHRFASRGVAVYRRRLTAFSDLYQYAAILSEDAAGDAAYFLQVLRSEAVQALLGEIGMLPAEGGTGSTVNAFLDGASRAALASAARAGGPRKNIDNFLKTV